MKKWILMLCISVSLLGMNACNNSDDNDQAKRGGDTSIRNDDKGDDIPVSQVPQVVQTAFASKYNGATDIKWETATENGTPTYKVKFDYNGERKNAEFASDGSFIKD
jgi:hypothetical protein